MLRNLFNPHLNDLASMRFSASVTAWILFLVHFYRIFNMLNNFESGWRIKPTYPKQWYENSACPLSFLLQARSWMILWTFASPGIWISSALGSFLRRPEVIAPQSSNDIRTLGLFLRSGVIPTSLASVALIWIEYKVCLYGFPKASSSHSTITAHQY